MNTISTIVVGFGVAAGIALGMTVGNFGHDKRHPGRSAARAPVLVELFTSEGCSSCPPADKLLAKLQNNQPADGALIVPLSEHVDYWDGASWRDPFSSPLFSARQAAYVKALGAQGPYTPQMVVDGRSEFVGSDEDAALRSIDNSAETRKAKVDVSASIEGADSINVSISIKSLSAVPADASNDVYIAVAENNLSSQVRGGENGGRHLLHTAVVRSLQKVGAVQPGAPFSGRYNLKLDPRWKTKDITVVSFIQARSNRRILGVGISTLPKS